MKKLLLILFSVFLMSTLTSCYLGSQLGDQNDNLFKKNHKITLVIEGKAKEMATVDDGEVLNINFTPKRQDYMFKGWYTDSSCTVPYDFSRPVTTSFNLYAGFALEIKRNKCTDVSIKALSRSYDNYKSFGLSLVGFDYEYLEKNGMGLQFQIIYSVKYKKDYNVIFDIGYAGSPKYEISLINESLSGYFEYDLPTTQSEERCIYIYNTTLDFSKGQQVSLVFSTDNVQNIISYTDIVVIITAIKLK